MVTDLTSAFPQSDASAPGAFGTPADEEVPYARIYKTGTILDEHPDLLRAYCVMEHSHRNSKARRNGDPYIVHPLDIGNKMLEHGDLWAAIISFLHDVLEHDKTLTKEHLKLYGFPNFVVDAVDLLSQKEINGQNESYVTYIDRIAKSKPEPDGKNYAIKVKIGDLEHNLESDEKLKATGTLKFKPEHITKNFVYRASLAYLKAVENGQEITSAILRQNTITSKVSEIGLLSFTFHTFGPDSNEFKAVKELSFPSPSIKPIQPPRPRISL